MFGAFFNERGHGKIPGNEEHNRIQSLAVGDHKNNSKE
jgi:hypothetical protein